MRLKSLREYDNHEYIHQFSDDHSGLIGFIAIHNDNLGPTAGGTRFYNYKNRKAAARDVLKLSKSMTYKCAISGVPHGGAKGVIVGDIKSKNKKLLKAYANEVNKLQGNFYTGEDVGISENDVQYMINYSPYFIGKSNLAGDPSPYAALSTFITMKVVAKIVLDKNSLKNVTVAVKGIGKVGSSLVNMLAKENANIIIADTDQKAVSRIVKKYPKTKVVNTHQIIKQKADIYSPCAMGDDITGRNMRGIKASIICGAANNQFHSNKVGDWLFKKGIIYVPDYVANSGGLINVVDELEPGGYKKGRVVKRIYKMGTITREIIEQAVSAKIAPNRVSDEMAENIFKNGK